MYHQHHQLKKQQQRIMNVNTASHMLPPPQGLMSPPPSTSSDTSFNSRPPTPTNNNNNYNNNNYMMNTPPTPSYSSTTTSSPFLMNKPLPPTPSLLHPHMDSFDSTLTTATSSSNYHHHQQQQQHNHYNHYPTHQQQQQQQQQFKSPAGTPALLPFPSPAVSHFDHHDETSSFFEDEDALINDLTHNYHDTPNHHHDLFTSDEKHQQQDTGLFGDVPPAAENHNAPPPSTTTTTATTRPPQPPQPPQPTTLFSTYDLEWIEAAEWKLDSNQGLDMNDRMARRAVRWTLRTCAKLDGWECDQVLGFGSNGVVLAAKLRDDPSTKIALKIIYKDTTKKLPFTPSNPQSPIAPDTRIPKEITLLHTISTQAPHPSILSLSDAWQDERHFYIVTNLHGTPWLNVASSATPAGERDPTSAVISRLEFWNHRTQRGETMSFQPGSGDLWAWHFAMRTLYTDQKLPLHIRKRIFRQMAHGVHHLHSLGIVHGDLKEENILIQDPTFHTPTTATTYLRPIHIQNMQPTVRIADFGHANATFLSSSSPHTPLLKKYGTPEMTPPELQHKLKHTTSSSSSQLGGPHKVDGRPCDVWALGLLLFAISHGPGRLPDAVQWTVRDGGRLRKGERYPLSDWDETLEDGLKELVEGMLEVDPGRRWRMEDVLRHPWVRED
ncbi:hypothetical protein HDV05_005355 [Chytridiales sp. JEL 0842]|nr:hypothetical protein HDV05_005355 [Chytridiales sp. JEL 0842]